MVVEKIFITEWLSKEDLEQYKNDQEPYNAPICPYIEPKPNQLGKCIWVKIILN